MGKTGSRYTLGKWWSETSLRYKRNNLRFDKYYSMFDTHIFVSQQADN